MSKNEFPPGLLTEQNHDLAESYQFYRMLGHGSFGTVYEVKNKNTKEMSALKVVNEKSMSKSKTLVNEINILKKLQGINGIPCLRNYGKYKKGCYFEIQLLGHSLQEKISANITTNELIQMGKELLLILKSIHEKKVIHQDIKPQNIMKGINGRYYFIDFGLSRIKNKEKQSGRYPGFIGTPRFASIAAHKGIYQTQKDDVQSLFYVLAFLYFKELPWFKIYIEKERKIHEIKRKKQCYSEQVFKGISSAFSHAFEYVTQLKHSETVDYHYIISILGKHRNTFPAFSLLSPPKEKNSLTIQSIYFQKSKIDLIKVDKSTNNFSNIAQLQCLSALQLYADKILFSGENADSEDEGNISEGDEQTLKVVKNKRVNITFKNPFFNA